MKTEKEKKPR